MKILYIHQHFSTPSGFGGIRSYQMAKAAIAAGHEVVMVCGSHGSGKTGLSGDFQNGIRRGTVEGIEVIEHDLAYSNRDGFLKRSATFVRFAFSSARIALFEPYDLLFATSTPLTVAIPGILGRWVRRKSFVFEVRDLWPELPRAMRVIRNPIVLGALRVLEWAAYKSAHRLIGLSPGIVDGIKKGGANAPVALIPNGCDLGIFGTDAPMWQPDGIKSDDLVAVFSGTHGLANGLGAILDAAAVLKARGCERVKFILIGDGGQKDGLKSRAQAEGLSNVLFLEPVDKQRLAGLMKRANIGIQCLANVPAFYFGTSPNKFFDYIAAGLPVLNNYPGWLADMITTNECGVSVPPEDPEAMADALAALIGQEQALQLMGARARALAESQFDRTTLAREWVELCCG